MAIFPHHARFLIKEHKRCPISGTILTMGRQTITMTAEEVKTVFRQEGIDARPADVMGDNYTVHNLKRAIIDDKSFFAMLSDARVFSLDVNSYEGADIICDLNGDLHPHLCNVADFILNGSVLDDIFDPAQALRNMSAMLRPGGRIMIYESATQQGLGGGYLTFSPEWFFTFFRENNYDKCQIYLCHYEDHHGRWDVFEWAPYMNGEPAPALARKDDATIVVIAQKGMASRNDRKPLRSNYRQMYGMQPYKPFDMDTHLFDRTREYRMSFKQRLGGWLDRCGLIVGNGHIGIKPKQTGSYGQGTRFLGSMNYRYDHDGWHL